MKVNAIYTLPIWYKPDKYSISHDGVVNLGEQTTECFYHALEENYKLEEWIIDTIWEGDYENDDLIGKRLAFLLDLRNRDFNTYNQMSNEKTLIYSLQNERPEIYKAYLKYSGE